MEIHMKEVIKKMYLSPIRDIMVRAAGLKAQGRDVISFGAGDSDFATPEPIKQAAKEAIDRDLSHYETIWGNDLLRHKIIERYQKKYHITYEMDEVLITAAGTEAIADTFLALIEPGDEVIVLSPAFINYENCITMAGGKTVIVSLEEADGFLPNVEKIRQAVTPHTKMLVLNNPCNPTGVVYPKRILEQIAELAKEKDLLLFADEVYDQILYDDTEFCSMAALPGMKERTIVANSFSKMFAMTGWRVGWLMAGGEVMEALYKVHHYATACQPTFIQEALAQAMDQPETIRAQQHMVDVFDRRRTLVTDWIKSQPKLQFVMPEGAFYVFVNVSATGLDGRSFALKLLDEAGVAVVPGVGLGEAYGDYIRISYAVEDTRLLEGLKRMEDFVGRKEK